MSNKNTGAGKGDSPRPVSPKKYGENYDRIFRKNLFSFKDEEEIETIAVDEEAPENLRKLAWRELGQRLQHERDRI